MKLDDWQYKALNFPYSDGGLVEKLYAEFSAAGGAKRGRGRPAGPAYPERDAKFIELYKEGKTLDEIGKQYGLTREGVRQRLAKMGITKEDGGSAIRMFKKIPDRIIAQQMKKEKSDQRHFAKWGCSKEFILAISDLPYSNKSHPLFKYRVHKRNALRGSAAGFNMTFPEWWKVWQDSGKWELRGRGKGYCMGRFGDTGPYEVGNVYITTIGKNFSDSYITKPWETRFPKIAKEFKTKVRFFWIKRQNAWQVSFQRKHIGTIRVAL
jgi:hypothetical protein